MYTIYGVQNAQRTLQISWIKEGTTVKMKHVAILTGLFMTLLVVGCSNHGSANPASNMLENTITSGDHICEEHNQDRGYTSEVGSEEIQDSDADLVVFSNIEAFSAYAISAEKESDVAELASLRYYFTPTGIPEEYKLYKITAGIADIGFWYLPDECLSSTDAILEAESSQKHFLFISTRGTYEFGSVMAQLGITQNELIDGRYLVREGPDRMVIWEDNNVTLMLYLPADYEADSISSLCKSDQYIKNERAHTFECMKETIKSTEA